MRVRVTVLAAVLHFLAAISSAQSPLTTAATMFKEFKELLDKAPGLVDLQEPPSVRWQEEAGPSFLDKALLDHDSILELYSEVHDFRNPGGSLRNADRAIRFFVLAVPDPSSTGLAREYDLAIEATKLAFESAGRTFDRSVLPWELEDQDRSATLGVLMFRKDGHAPVAEQSPAYDIVLVVPESPNRGIDETSFFSAIDLAFRLSRVRPPGGPPDDAATEEGDREAEDAEDGPAEKTRTGEAEEVDPGGVATLSSIRLIGPTFSGSMHSIARILDALDLHLREAAHELSLELVSGSASAPANWELLGDLSRSLRARREKLSVDEAERATGGVSLHWHLLATQSSDLLHAILARLRSEHGIEQSEVVVFAESSTFGFSTVSALSQDAGEPDGLQADAPVQPTQAPHIITFPMNIAGLYDARSEAESESAPSSTTSILNYRYLPLDLTERRKRSDLPNALGEQETVLTQELRLENVLQRVVRRRYRAAVVLATDVKDRLFLLSAIRRSAPDLRLATLEADLLLAHPDHFDDLRGALTSSSRKLFWSFSDNAGRHEEIQFANDISTGIFCASRWALDHRSDPFCANCTVLGLIGRGRIFELGSDTLHEDFSHSSPLRHPPLLTAMFLTLLASVVMLANRISRSTIGMSRPTGPTGIAFLGDTTLEEGSRLLSFLRVAVLGCIFVLTSVALSSIPDVKETLSNAGTTHFVTMLVIALVAVPGLGFALNRMTNSFSQADWSNWPNRFRSVLLIVGFVTAAIAAALPVLLLSGILEVPPLAGEPERSLLLSSGLNPYLALFVLLLPPLFVSLHAWNVVRRHRLSQSGRRRAELLSLSEDASSQLVGTLFGREWVDATLAVLSAALVIVPAIVVAIGRENGVDTVEGPYFDLLSGLAMVFAVLIAVACLHRARTGFSALRFALRDLEDSTSDPGSDPPSDGPSSEPGAEVAESSAQEEGQPKPEGDVTVLPRLVFEDGVSTITQDLTTAAGAAVCLLIGLTLFPFFPRGLLMTIATLTTLIVVLVTAYLLPKLSSVRQQFDKLQDVKEDPHVARLLSQIAGYTGVPLLVAAWSQSPALQDASMSIFSAIASFLF